MDTCHFSVHQVMHQWSRTRQKFLTEGSMRTRNLMVSGTFIPYIPVRRRAVEIERLLDQAWLWSRSSVVRPFVEQAVSPTTSPLCLYWCSEMRPGPRLQGVQVSLGWIFFWWYWWLYDWSVMLGQFYLLKIHRGLRNTGDSLSLLQELIILAGVAQKKIVWLVKRQLSSEPSCKKLYKNPPPPNKE